MNFNNGNVNNNDKNNSLRVRAVRGGSCGPDLYSFRALWRHYRNCRRNKLRVYDDIEEAPEQVVYVRAVEVKQGNRVRIAGKVIEL